MHFQMHPRETLLMQSRVSSSSLPAACHVALFGDSYSVVTAYCGKSMSDSHEPVSCGYNGFEPVDSHVIARVQRG